MMRVIAIVAIFCSGVSISRVMTAVLLQNPSDAAKQLCDRISEIKVLPFKSEEVEDAVFNGLKSLDGAAFPCLAEEITNSKIMEDPRQAPRYGSVRVGDVAFWILVDLAKLPYDDMFPEQVRQRFKDEGVFAYFEWVKSFKHRRLLQQNVKAYLARRSPR